MIIIGKRNQTMMIINISKNQTIADKCTVIIVVVVVASSRNVVYY